MTESSGDPAGWVILPAELVDDRRLSFAAIGVYAYINSHEVGTVIDEEELDQPEAVAELRQYGYLEP